MSLDNVASAARLAQGQAERAAADADFYRRQRDELIIELRKGGWTIGKIAQAVGISRGLVAVICRPVSTGTGR